MVNLAVTENWIKYKTTYDPMKKQEMEIKRTNLLSWCGSGKAFFISLPEYCHNLGKYIWSCLFYSFQFDKYLHINKDINTKNDEYKLV